MATNCPATIQGSTVDQPHRSLADADLSTQPALDELQQLLRQNNLRARRCAGRLPASWPALFFRSTQAAFAPVTTQAIQIHGLLEALNRMNNGPPSPRPRDGSPPAPCRRHGARGC